MKKLQLSFVLALVSATALALVAGVPAAAAAQSADSTPARPQGAQATVDSAAFERARQLVLSGHAVAGRALADSLVALAPPGTDAYGEALYWRATLSTTAADAERDYRRIIIEYALAPHAGDALLALAQLEMSRGDRPSATSHLQRFLLEYPTRSDRPRAGMWLGRLLLDQGDLPRGCAALAEARSGTPAEQVELRNQIDYFAARCAGVETATASRGGAASAAASPPVASPAVPPAPADKTAQHDSGARPPRDTTTPPAHDTAARPARDTGGRPPRDTAPRPARDTGARPPRDTADRPASGVAAQPPRDAAPRPTRDTAARVAGQWTVQIAAYQNEGDADALVTKLRERGHDAYLVRAARIYRVRIGHFATRDDALAALQSLARNGTRGFVTTAESPTR